VKSSFAPFAAALRYRTNTLRAKNVETSEHKRHADAQRPLMSLGRWESALPAMKLGAGAARALVVSICA
jgi:hypothetical protein